MNIDDLLKKNAPNIKQIKYRITKIKEFDNRVIIFLDNKEKINLSVDIYFKYSISSLKGLDDDLYKCLKDEERLFIGYRGALRKLSTKDFTIKQIKDYLRIKTELNNDEIEKIVSKLLEYRLLDDEKYCQNRSKYLNKQLLSIKQIKTKLAKEGINSDLIDKYVIIRREDEYLKAKKLAEKYSLSIKNKSLNAKKQSILTKLVNVGYSYDASKDAVNSLNIESDNELSLLNKEYTKAKNKYGKKYENYDLRNHIYSYLLNKGFKSEDIKKIMEV